MKNKTANPTPLEEESNPTFRIGLTGKLTLWFLVLSLIPLILISVISYRTARNSLRETAADALSAVTESHVERIKAYFDRTSKDLKQQAESLNNVKFLSSLTMDLEESAVESAQEFVHSARWEKRVSELEADLQNLRDLYGYRDLFLIDKAGNVLYSTLREENFGHNLFIDPLLQQTLFSKACQRSLWNGQAVFSDFEHLNNGLVVGYLVAPIVDPDGETLGLFAMQMETQYINTIMDSGGMLGATSESYLIGTDLIMRSKSRLYGSSAILSTSINTELSRHWKAEEHNPDKRNAPENHTLLSYSNYRDLPVLGTFRTLNIEGIRFGVISEIEQSEAYAPAKQLALTSFLLLGITAILVSLLSSAVARRTVKPLRLLATWARRIGHGDLSDVKINTPADETGILNQTFRQTVSTLRADKEERKVNDWITEGIAQINDAMRGKENMEELCRCIMASLCHHLDAQIGSIFLVPYGRKRLIYSGGFAFSPRSGHSIEFRFGEGLVGQSALGKETILVNHVSEERFILNLAEGTAVPHSVACIPLLYDDLVTGVIEIGSLNPITENHMTFLERVSEYIAISIHSAKMHEQTHILLGESQAQSEELQTQEERLRAANEELEEKSEELQEKTNSLEQQTEQIKEQNRQLGEAGKALKQKADDLAMASKYKSEFLANMSHELRTPLNSLLVLAHHLAENRKGNLSDDEVESASVIAASGENLLILINDILDLSKIEAGKMILQPRPANFEDIRAVTRSYFVHMAEEKGLKFEVEIDDALPESMHTDPERLQQIIRNLVSNALKFTHQGQVILSFARPNANADLVVSGLDPKSSIALSVRDSGIGIPPEKFKAVFEAFQQADGSTSRRYGGTGLGLSITRELAHLLGGEVTVESAEGQGSTFTVYLPEHLAASADDEEPPHLETPAPSSPPAPPFFIETVDAPSIPDDRDRLAKGDKVVLFIEDDPLFAKTLSMMAHENQFKCLHAADGPSGIKIAKKYQPDAITLDIRMPGMDGWEVLEKLKENIHTRHIPVHIISVEDPRHDAVQRGALGYLSKPVSREDLDRAFGRIGEANAKRVKELLIVEDDDTMQLAITKLLGSDQVKTTSARSIKEAVNVLKNGTVDCMILDLNLPDGSGADLLKRISRDEGLSVPPVIVYTGSELSREQHEQLREYTQSIIVKGPMAEERLVDETALFLHQVIEKMPDRKKKMVMRLHDGDAALEGKTILLADDDMRNVFALSKVLESKGLTVRKAADGEKALKRLREDPDIALVLMDIMMPNMDGYETMRRIRDPESDVPNHEIPIIALTAKAMREDRAKCIEAGANDYQSKPVDVEKLLSLMRVWLVKQ